MSVPDIELYYYDGSGYTSFNAPIQSVSISRGRSRQLNRFESGSAVINFYNGDRLLDPLNDSSAYQDLVVPRLRLRLLADSTHIFTGVVKDWDVSYEINLRDTASAVCSDDFTTLSSYVFTQPVTFDENSCGDRIDDVLTYFSYPGTKNIDLGNVTLGEGVVNNGVQALDYIFNVASSDNGNLFVAADGTVTFVGRYGRRNITELTFADDGTGINYSSLINQYGDELLFNRVSVTASGGFAQLEDTTSISNFGLSVLDLTGLLNANQPEIDALASDYFNNFRNPAVRFTGLTVELAGLSSADVEDLLDLDLADQVAVKKSFAGGSPGSVTQVLIVTGIRHSIVPGSHKIEFSFERSPYSDAFVLGDANFGVLNTDVLG
jgi:hypothetical protein